MVSKLVFLIFQGNHLFALIAVILLAIPSENLSLDFSGFCFVFTTAFNQSLEPLPSLSFCQSPSLIFQISGQDSCHHLLAGLTSHFMLVLFLGAQILHGPMLTMEKIPSIYQISLQSGPIDARFSKLKMQNAQLTLNFS